MYGWTRVSRSLMSLAARSPNSSLNLQSTRRLFSKMKHFKLSWAPWTSTPAHVNHATYSLRVSFFSWMMEFSAAMVFGFFLFVVKLKANLSHSYFQELIELSSSPLNQVMARPFNVKINYLHFTAPRASHSWGRCSSESVLLSLVTIFLVKGPLRWILSWRSGEWSSFLWWLWHGGEYFPPWRFEGFPRWQGEGGTATSSVLVVGRFSTALRWFAGMEATSFIATSVAWRLFH